MKIFLLIFTLVPGMLFSQSHEIPYNSKGNSLALTVENTAAITAKNVTVEVQSPPGWLKLESSKLMLKDILAQKSKEAGLEFSVERSAPVGVEQKISVLIKTSDGQLWTKDIAFAVGAPKEFHLFDNFPNPFSAGG